MGLFGKKETCCICNQNEGVKRILDGTICKQCIDNCGPFLGVLDMKNNSSTRIREAIAASNTNRERYDIFKAEKSIQKYIELDEAHHFLRFPQSLPAVIFSYDEIIDYELLQDGETITKGSLGGAIVGGALMGGVGALVGGSLGKKKTKQEITEYRIKITTKNSFRPTVYINFLSTGKVKSNSLSYKMCVGDAQGVLSQLTIITNFTSNSTVPSSTSGADEILKFKNLLDQGIITEEEFIAKKKQLLGL